MKLLPRIVSILFIVAVPVFLITANIRFFAGEAWFYERGFRAHDADEATGLPFSELDRAGAEIRRYFEDDAEVLAIAVMVDGESQPLFNEEEVLHMADVKDVMRVLFRVNEVALAVVLLTVGGRFLWAREGSLRVLARDTLFGLGLGLAVAAAFGAIAIAAFDEAWDRFHELLFTNDFWQLNPDTDRLIQMFPERYWEESVLLISAMVGAQGLALAIVAAAYLWFSRFSRSGRAQPEAAEPNGVAAVEPGEG